MKHSIDPVEARQGRNGPRILIVLVAGLALALIAWAGADLIVPDDRQTTIQNGQDATPSSSQPTKEQ